MKLNEEHIQCLTSILLDFIEEPEDYIAPRMFTSSEFDDFTDDEHTTYGFTVDNSNELLHQFSEKDYNICDETVNAILDIVLINKSIINDRIKYDLHDDELKNSAKEKRKTINALIRYIKAYSSENGIQLPCLEEHENSF